MAENILTRQMQDQYISIRARQEIADKKYRNAEGKFLTVLVSIGYFSIPVGLLGLIAWIATSNGTSEAAVAAVILSAIFILPMSVMFYVMDGFLRWWFETRNYHTRNKLDGVLNDMNDWWSQVSDLLDRSGRGTIHRPYDQEHKKLPSRSWYKADNTEVLLTAAVKNGNVWLVDPSGDVLARTYAEKTMTTLITDDGRRIAVTGAAAEIIGERTNHPTL